MSSDPETPTTGFDYEGLAESVEQLREVVAAMVAGLVADGFTDREARQIIAASVAVGDDG